MAKEIKYNRIFLIVTDSVGIGGDKEAQRFGDKGANTLYSVSKTGLLKIPTWKKLGIDSIAKLTGFNKVKNQHAFMARVEEKSNAKDTLAGHWEMMGLITKEPLPTFTKDGFPKDLLDELEKAFDGRKIVCNASISGTKAIKLWAEEEINNNSIIVYTSGDSVLQICGHEKHMGLNTLYNYAKKARQICSSKKEWNVGRIIARPYIGQNGKWTRTSNRHDYALSPPSETMLSRLQEAKVNVIGIGKIGDIFGMKGINDSWPTETDDHGMDLTINHATKKTTRELIFVNLVQFDSDFGHRRDAEGYAHNLNRFDIKLAKLLNAMQKDDLLLITADHGNDPTWKGFNHTREHVPLTIYSKSLTKKPTALSNFKGFATIGNILASNFGAKLFKSGQDRWDDWN